MKRALLIALFIVPFFGLSQTTKPIEGFLGIKFGSSRAAVVAALKAKGGILDAKESTVDFIACKNIKLGHRDVTLFLVKFVNDKAFEADFIFSPELEAKVLEYYYELVNDMNENYGVGGAHRKYQSPYNDQDDDGIKIDAIRNGKADFKTIWQSSSKNSIVASIDEGLNVALTYQDAVLTDQAVQMQKSKDKSDF